MQRLDVPWPQLPSGAFLPGIRAQHKETGIIGRNAHEKEHEVIDSEERPPQTQQ